MAPRRNAPLADGPDSPADLRRIRVLQAVSDAHLAVLFSQLERRRVKARARISIAKEIVGKIGFVWSGRFCKMVGSIADGTTPLAEFETGAMFDFPLERLAFKPGSASHFVAEEPGTLLLVPSALFLRLAEESLPIANAINVELSKLITEIGARVFRLAILDVRYRLQAELLRLAHKTQANGGVYVIHPAPTRAALGVAIGATREAVSRSLKDLANEGAIVLENRTIKIPDLRALAGKPQSALSEYRAFLQSTS